MTERRGSENFFRLKKGGEDFFTENIFSKPVNFVQSLLYFFLKQPDMELRTSLTVYLDRVNIQDFLQIFQGSGIGKMEDNFG